jgi:hypothetical protein
MDNMTDYDIKDWMTNNIMNQINEWECLIEREFKDVVAQAGYVFETTEEYNSFIRLNCKVEYTQECTLYYLKGNVVMSINRSINGNEIKLILNR